ncbi:hypothetical protein PT2222_40087 [Paraburkholderia tropica]
MSGAQKTACAHNYRQIFAMALRPTKQKGKRCFPENLERETSLELATSTLARLRSTN